jgi:hypothetical protein
MLLEQQLALELHDRGDLRAIYPVLVGELKYHSDEIGDWYSDFFKTGGVPACPDEVVKAVRPGDRATKIILHHPFRNSLEPSDGHSNSHQLSSRCKSLMPMKLKRPSARSNMAARAHSRPSKGSYLFRGIKRCISATPKSILSASK